MGMPGYAGNILYLDLTSGGMRKEPIDAELAKTFVGGQRLKPWSRGLETHVCHFDGAAVCWRLNSIWVTTADR